MNFSGKCVIIEYLKINAGQSKMNYAMQWENWLASQVHLNRHN
jgi:hypothetical protein